jgi:transposase-like protein
MTGSNQEQRPARRRRSFTAEFKADAVALVLVEGRPLLMWPEASA